MKRLSFSCLALSIAAVLGAQTYTFESGVPTNFSATNGTLTATTEHYKESSRSLLWEANGVSSLTISDLDYQMTSSSAFYTQMYLPQVTNDTIVFQFLYNDVVKREGRILCNFRGWRELQRQYSLFGQSGNPYAEKLIFTLHPASGGKRYICFDNMKLKATPDNAYIPGCMWALDYQYLNCAADAPLSFYINQPDIPASQPTAQELTDLATIRSRVKTTNSYNATQALSAKTWVNNNISVTTNADGTIHGTIMDNSAAALTDANMKTPLSRLQYLAAGKEKGDAELTKAFDNYLNNLLDQGFSDGCNIAVHSNAYTAPRTYIPPLLAILPACDSTQRSEVCKLGRWICQYYAMYYSEDTWIYNNVSDIIYLFLSYFETLAAWDPDDATAVRELKACKRYIERSLTYAPGPKDIVKPDGCGFHHNTHHHSYMYAFQTLTTGIYALRQTCFEVDETAYRHAAQAIQTEYMLSTLSTTDTRFMSITMSGRGSFSGGISTQYNKAKFLNLIQAGASYPEAQKEVQAMYNYFFQTNTYDVEPADLEGFHAYNWSPVGVMRKDKWVATMHAPTAKLWSSEIYSGTNRLGRYQGHGVLDILYSASKAQALGYPGTTGGGWDWNMTPGSTTVHYTSWTEMMPKGNTTQRFDQYAKSSNFSGACGLGMYGVWACDFDQIDTWGSQCYTPTNLVFHKSVFALDSILVAFGTGIGASGSYSDGMITATNLYQQIIDGTNLKGSHVIDGTTQNIGKTQTLSGKTSHWMYTPNTTGYYLPKGNDDIVVSYAAQKTPKQDGSDCASPSTSANAVKAYINHGVKTADHSYVFIAVPASTKEKMQALANAYDQQLPYTVLQCDNTMHAIQADNVWAYAIFSPVSGLTNGLLRSTTHQHLLVAQQEDSTLKISVCNPNLEPQTDSKAGWVSTPTNTLLTLNGEWEMVEGDEGVTYISANKGITQLQIVFTDGLPLTFTLVKKGTTGLVEPEEATAPFKFLEGNQLVICRDGKQYSVYGQSIQ